MIKYLAVIFSLFLNVENITAQEIIPLYPEGIPNSQPSDEVEKTNTQNFEWIQFIQEPTLEVYLPTKRNATGQAVVICPGGGYWGVAYDWEGTEFAKWFNSKGIAAFVLKYRMPNSKSVLVGNEAPLQDAQRAMRIVRSNATEWNIESDKIGVMGFSAGGHLASTLGTHYNYNNADFYNPNSIDSVSARPNFMVLIYPVVSMDSSFTHKGSRGSLLGEHPSSDLVEFYSNELQITEQTPPTFLLHASDDDVVPVKNSLVFYEALIQKSVSAEMHIYPTGGHGFGFGIKRGPQYLQTWTNRLFDWMNNLED